VDGYNVTKTHRGELQPAEQRDWLIGLLSGAAARMGLDVTIVFDGAHGVGLGQQRSRGIRVEFSRGGLSADDDICFLVATIDAGVPITVVTDDGELRQRLAPDHVDLLFTRELLWAVG
jgi:predicted RNA-binding protein with PIN domain